MAKLQMVPLHKGDLPEWKPPQNLKHAATVISQLALTVHENGYLLGRTLLWVKKEVGHGDFVGWIETNVRRFTERTAARMMSHAKRCDKAGTLIEYHPRKRDTVSLLTMSKRKPKHVEPADDLASVPDPMPPESRCYFDIAHRLQQTYHDLSKDDQTQLLAMLRALLDGLEKGDTVELL